MCRFDAKKAVQAAAVLLEVESGRMDYYRLLKLLYIADRQSMAETGFPITLAHAWALPQGPIPSEIYDLVKGSRTDAREWSAYIEKHGYQVRLVQDPGRGKLSRYEVRKLQDVAESFSAIPDWEVGNVTHEFAEFKQHEPKSNSSNPIPFEDILEAVGQGAHKDEILNDLRTKARIDEFVEAYKP